jgi:hypothetical protein
MNRATEIGIERFDFKKRLKQGECVDWHVHTTYSDGVLTPTQVVRLAKKKGLREIAIADHDSVEGVGEAIREGRKIGVEVIPNIEMTAYDVIRSSEREVHILGFGVDRGNPALKKVLRKCRARRAKRARLIVRKLRKLGYKISFSDVKALAGRGVIGRPHVAQALLQRRENRAKMRRDFKLKREPCFNDVFVFLIKHGKPAYVKKEVLAPKQVIRLISRAGGIPALAHPGFFEGVPSERVKTKGVPERKITEYKKYGLKAMEVYYPHHSKKQTRFYARIARKLGLVATGGSDYHGIPEQGIKLGEII